ncbi:Ig-like domain-containing protein, partial [Halomonas cupida]|uniref:Ig-like domain-containing protein n=1 Tax=Halomonas cupida TaxID=44933 RepID=UPI003EF947D9
VANADTGTTDEGTPTSGNVLPNDTDADDSDILTVSEIANQDGDSVAPGLPITGNNGGEFTLEEDGSYTFNPNGDFDDLAMGETRTSTVTYQINDGNGGTDTATLTITVTGTNDVPTSTDDLPEQSDADGSEITPV